MGRSRGTGIKLRPKPANPQGKAHNRGQSTISGKIEYLIEEEGLTPKHAVGKAYGMARHGNLGPSAKRAAGRRRK